jgi:putative transposase
MPEYRRVYLKGGTYFFTVVTYKRIHVFKNVPAIRLLNDCIKATMQNYPFKINAMVILPDHVHTIWTMPDVDDDFSTRWRLIKKRFSRKFQSVHPASVSGSMVKKQEQGIWQKRFWEHLIRDDEDFNMHCDYIHYNPVKHGLVKSPGSWEHTSYHQFVNKGLYPPNWGIHEPEKLQKVSYE